ncbi:MAG: hypothetical protein EOP32_12020 [Rhodococcus sp. (in: high G+C Gram-positive bacteria)]|nr:MAG: hypothetical protein EOP32_12020 [Rhodococcus sp. (in: high G+C Gram-positive bacteria)]
MKLNGWTLTFATANGVRIWQHDSGKLDVRGVDGLNFDQLEEFIDWLEACTFAREFVPMPKYAGRLEEADLADLLELDADEFLEPVVGVGAG